MLSNCPKIRCSFLSRSVLQLLVISIAVLLNACGGGGELVPNPSDNNGNPVNHPGSNNQMPEARFEIDQSGGPKVIFDARGSLDKDGGIVRYQWAFGDGATAEGVRVEHLYTVAGSFEAVLTVTDNQGGKTTAVQTINIASQYPPVAVISAPTDRGVAPLTLEFSADLSYDPDGKVVAYEWLFDNIDPYNNDLRNSGVTARRTFVEEGDYAVTLRVTDDEGLTSEQTFQVRVFPSNVRFSMSGTITALPYTDVDGDVNDALADYFDNNGHTPANIQPISNPVLLNGFATATQTGQLSDAFAFEADRHDIYSVDLNQGDFISMRVVDYLIGDLDLVLIDATTYDPVASSTGQGEFESVQAPKTGKYVVMVNAVSRSSRYILKVGRTSFVNGASAAGQSMDFEEDQAIFKKRAGWVRSLSVLDQAQAKLTHKGTERPALAKMNPLNPQTQNVFQLSATPEGFEHLLAQRNPKAYAKLRTLKTIKRLRQQPDIEFAEPNYRVRSMLRPNDPFYVYQWHYGAINLPQAWDITTGNADVVVAVIDSGVYMNHPDLRGQLVGGYDFISDPDTANDGDGIDPDPSDPGDSIHVGSSSWHGTHVTGTVVAAMNNREGGVGVAPGVKVMPVRAIGLGGGLSYDVLQAVRYAAGLENDSGTLPEKPADIINLSLGGGGYSFAGQELYRAVRAKGIIVVAAAGNEASNEPLYPASYDGVISVAATDVDGKRAPYSNTGPYVDVAAPGGNMAVDRNNDGYADGIMSTSVIETNGRKTKSYVFYQGTSMATPHVSGIIALMKSVHPGLTPEQVDSLLVSGTITVDKGALGRDNEYGHGLIDADKAVEAARSLAEGGTTAAVTPSTTMLVFDSADEVLPLELTSLGNGVIRVTRIETSEPWLQVEALNVNTAGVGTYEILVDRTDLSDGLYLGFIEFTTDLGSSIKIQVNMRVGEFVPTGNAGYLYVLLIDANLGGTVAVHEGAAKEGRYQYRFDNVPAGDYFIVAGSDINNDGYVCELGESCGFFPTMADAVLIRADRDREHLDFPAGLSPTLTTQGVDSNPQGYSRVLYHY